MAEGPPKNNRSHSDGFLSIHNTYIISANDLTQTQFNAGSDNKNFVSNTLKDNSTGNFGDVSAASDRVSDAELTYQQSARSRDRSYPTLPTSRQPLLLGSSIEPGRDWSPEPTLEETKHLLKNFYVEDSQADGSTVAGFEPSSEDREDDWANEGSELDEQHDEPDDEEGGEKDDTEEDDDGLNMASSSSKYSQTTLNDNKTVHHKYSQQTTSHNNYMDPGQVITITSDRDMQLSGRTMVVMARSEENALQCVSLCIHPGKPSRDHQKYVNSHVPVYASAAAPDTVPNFKTKVVIDFDDENAVLDGSCFINCQHVWTIRSGVRYSVEGTVRDFKELLVAFGEIQTKFYRSVRKQNGLED